MTYDSRSRKRNKFVKINCPDHKTTTTYDLFKDGKIKGIGCYKCFEYLKAIEPTDEMYVQRKKRKSLT